MLRAGLNTLAAGGTNIRIDHRDTITEMDGIKLTGIHTVAQADAAVGTFLRTAEQSLCCRAALHSSGILIQWLRVLPGSVAGNKGNLTLHISRGCSKRCRKLCRNRRTANRALRTGNRLCCILIRKSMCVVIAARISAAAAVRTGKLCAQIQKQLILLHRKYLRSIGKKDSGNKTNHKDQYNCNNDQIHNDTSPNRSFQTIQIIPENPINARDRIAAVVRIIGTP